MSRTLAMVLLASMMAGCNASTQSDDTLTRAFKLDASLPDQAPPAEDMRPCADPVRIPRNSKSAGAVERLWRQDRVALVDCGQRKENVQQFYRDRDERLAGVAKQ